MREVSMAQETCTYMDFSLGSFSSNRDWTNLMVSSDDGEPGSIKDETVSGWYYAMACIYRVGTNLAVSSDDGEHEIKHKYNLYITLCPVYIYTYIIVTCIFGETQRERFRFDPLLVDVFLV